MTCFRSAGREGERPFLYKFNLKISISYLSIIIKLGPWRGGGVPGSTGHKTTVWRGVACRGMAQDEFRIIKKY